jgi:hypothetical protein
MIHWIESQPTVVIAILVCGGCYVLTTIIFSGAIIVGRFKVGEELKTISPVTLTPLAVILALLIAFLASRVWENAGHANEYIGQEASALSKVLLFADTLTPDVRAKVRASVAQHIDFVISRDWPDMAAAMANPKSEPVALTDAAKALFSFVPTTPSQVLAQQRAVAAIEQAFEARRNRLRLSQAEIATIQWVVVVLLATLILITTALIHIGKPANMATTMFIFSTAVAASLVLLMDNDRPFAPGGITITPAAFREIVLN